MKVSIFFAWYDLWIGFFYDRDKRALYFCPLPTVVIKIQLKPKVDAASWLLSLSQQIEDTNVDKNTKEL